MRIDVHTHAMHPKISAKVVNKLDDYYHIHPVGNGRVDDLLKRAENAGLDKVVIHTAATEPAQVIPANNWSIQMMESDPHIISFGTMHPDYQEPEKEFARLERHGIKGLKFHPDFQGFWMNDPKFYEILEMIQGRFIAMFHVGDRKPPEKNPSCPIKLAEIHRNFPNLTIIAAHMGGIFHWKWSAEYLAGSNVYMDTSSAMPYIDDDSLQTILKKHPHEKLLFGSDYPLFDPGESMRFLQQKLHLTDSQLERHLCSAEKLFQ